jgi:hypothetical protein
MPLNREAEYSALRAFSDKITSWSGTLLFAAVNEATGSMRLAIFSLGVFFFIPLIIILFVPSQEPHALVHRRTEKINYINMPSPKHGGHDGIGQVSDDGSRDTKGDDTPSEATSRQDTGLLGLQHNNSDGTLPGLSRALSTKHSTAAAIAVTTTGSGTPTPQIGGHSAPVPDRTSIITVMTNANAALANNNNGTTLVLGNGTRSSPPISPSPPNGATNSPLVNGAFSPRSPHMHSMATGFITSPSPIPGSNGNGSGGNSPLGNSGGMTSLAIDGANGGSDSARGSHRSRSGSTHMAGTNSLRGHSTRHSVAPSVGAFNSMPGMLSPSIATGDDNGHNGLRSTGGSFVIVTSTPRRSADGIVTRTDSPDRPFTRTQSSTEDGPSPHNSGHRTLSSTPTPLPLSRHSSVGSAASDDNDSRPATSSGIIGNGSIPIMTIINEGPSSPSPLSPTSPTGRLGRTPLPSVHSNSPPSTSDGLPSSSGAGFLSPPLPNVSLRTPLQPRLMPLSAGAHMSGTLSPLTSARSSGTFAFVCHPHTSCLCMHHSHVM